MITRIAENRIKDLLQGFPCVAIIGPRQVGKTTLAKQIQKSYSESIYLDLELKKDYIKLDDPETDKIERVEAGAIAFGKGFFKKNIDECEYVNVLAYLNLNEWMGKRSVELLVKEIWV